ncbi:acetamidase/formamidase family protein [Heyndrickxia acidicola]|uniref:Acetamidase/formamidase family protein n=1 Tax=Heyndrickxia acidicola TaxID=209389 RepID=A0ABU6MGX3_9BACI|nr:acetamidase/formamidase family protein [Heyndrickxia acidicola]MED1203926.1 acetamidase/formamidase family protein [Heyndrickxia acidicola]
MYRVERKHLIYTMSDQNKPVLYVENGATVVFETCDCFEDQITSPDTPYHSLDWDRINPAAGPVFIEEAEPGDILEVKIEKIDLAEQGVMMTGPGLGVLGEELGENKIQMVPIKNEKVTLFDKVEVPVNKMIGVIGTAPANGESISCGTPDKHGGNMDSKVISEGSTLYLPVNVPGALLAMGDLHAAMGDGEVSVCGVEVAGEVTVIVNVIKGKQWKVPMVKTEQALYAIASEKSLDDAAVTATKNMAAFLESEAGMSKHDAVFLQSISGNLQISQVVDPLKTARFELPISIIQQLGIKI